MIAETQQKESIVELSKCCERLEKKISDLASISLDFNQTSKVQDTLEVLYESKRANKISMRKLYEFSRNLSCLSSIDESYGRKGVTKTSKDNGETMSTIKSSSFLT